MKQFVYAISLTLLLSVAAVRAEDKPNPAAAPAADRDVTLTGQVFTKKKGAPDNVIAAFKAAGVTYQLAAKDDDTAKQIKAVLNQKAEVKGTLKGDTITVSSIEKKTGRK